MSSFIAITPHLSTWEKQQKLLVLGLWCLTDPACKKYYEEHHGQIIPTPWRPTTRIKEAADYCYEVYQQILPLLAGELNQIHQVNFSDRYWQILLGPWLLSFIHVVYDRYKRLDNAFAQYPDGFINGVAVSDDFLQINDTIHFVYFLNNDDCFNANLYTDICQHFFPHKLKKLLDVPWNTKKNLEQKSSKLNLSNFILRGIDQVFPGKIVLNQTQHLSFKDKLRLKIQTGLTALSFRNIFPKAFSPSLYNKALRDFSINFVRPSGFEQYFTGLIPKALPKVYLEGYSSNRECVLKNRNGSHIKAVGSAFGWGYNEPFKFFAAEAMRNGAQLMEFQHGGGFGGSHSCFFEQFALQKDIFFTWGWDKKQSNTKSLTNPYLCRLKDIHKQQSDECIMVGTGAARYYLRFDAELSADDVPEYFINKQQFISHLPDEIKNNLSYRCYSVDWGWGEEEKIKDMCPPIKFIREGLLTDRLSKCKMVFIDHPSTSYLEALVMNVPCILFWDHNVFLMRPESEPYYEKLRTAGILFKDPLSAALKIQEVFHDPKQWWLTEKVQMARKEFCDRFALVKNDWLIDWKNTVKALCR
ncbi:MAG: hypothetical protein HQL26_07745 [Candidatus Omnitrophica bacterium]|nr:hypothetical protein [Candidatus Omnitrophota bacterium]